MLRRNWISVNTCKIAGYAGTCTFYIIGFGTFRSGFECIPIIEQVKHVHTNWIFTICLPINFKLYHYHKRTITGCYVFQQQVVNCMWFPKYICIRGFYFPFSVYGGRYQFESYNAQRRTPVNSIHSTNVIVISTVRVLNSSTF